MYWLRINEQPSRRNGAEKQWVRKPTISAWTLHSGKCEVMLVKRVYCTSGTLRSFFYAQISVLVNRGRIIGWWSSGGFPLTCSAPLETLPTLTSVLAVWVLAPECLACCGWHMKLQYLLGRMELQCTSGLYHLQWVLLQAVLLSLYPSPCPLLSPSIGQVKSQPGKSTKWAELINIMATNTGMLFLVFGRNWISWLLPLH